MSIRRHRMNATALGHRSEVAPAAAGHLCRPAPVRVAMLAAGLVSVLLSGCAVNGTRSESAAAVHVYAPVRAMPIMVRGRETAQNYYALGKYYFYQGRLGKASAAFLNALRLVPSSVDAMNGLAAVYDRQGQFDVAEKLYRAALAIDPKASRVWANLGYSMILRGRKPAAVSPLRQALEIDPGNAMARYFLDRIGSPPELAGQDGQKELGDQLAKAVAPKSPAKPAISTSRTDATLAKTGVASQSQQRIAAPMGSATIVASVVTAQGEITPVFTGNGLDLSSVTMSVPEVIRPDVRGDGELAATGGSPGGIIASIRSATANAQQTGNAGAGKITQAGEPVHALTRIPSKLRVEVSNGNGVEGMAHAVSAEIRRWGVNVARITNAKPFNKPRTYVISRPELHSVALRLAGMLPGHPRIVSGSTAYRRVDLRVVLGADSALAWNRHEQGRIRVADRSD